MEEDFDTPVLRPALIDSLFEAFLRIVAAYCLLFGVFYWVRLIGIYPGALWRFDTMPIEWQVASVVLAALFPIAGIGLWMTASWGPVIWFICAATEVVMFQAMSPIFGERQLIVASHILVAVIYAGFRTTLFFQRRQVRD
ncbi:DUF6163 family protein [Aquibium oceanicum]|uniref:Uncharacterized protein n=1 Tax=Aquibium oceanicum TaxID=1670800 RepID=A0A1L3SU69_9HYPH|nr:DUF6163 family protein [Aquibium oceanicum]APH72983.1 hypothetical protein BSQ44_17625 [Aquibium oceanicum]